MKAVIRIQITLNTSLFAKKYYSRATHRCVVSYATKAKILERAVYFSIQHRGRTSHEVCEKRRFRAACWTT